MCEIVENYAREVAEEAAKKAAKEATIKSAIEKEKEMSRRLFENGATYHLVMSSIKNIPEEELKAIYGEVHSHL